MVDVSVVIAAYNVEEHIARAIYSSLAQVDVSVETIVVDDASTDGTVSVVQAIADPRIRLLHNSENRGPAFSRNVGIQAAVGDWIAVLDSDDYWEPRRLKELSNFCERAHLDGVFDDMLLSVSGRVVRYSQHVKRNEKVMGKFPLSLLDVATTDVAFFKPLVARKFLTNSTVRYRDDLRYSEDFCFVFDLVAHGARLGVLDAAFYRYTIQRQGSLSSDGEK